MARETPEPGFGGSSRGCSGPTITTATPFPRICPPYLLQPTRSSSLPSTSGNMPGPSRPSGRQCRAWIGPDPGVQGRSPVFGAQHQLRATKIAGDFLAQSSAVGNLNIVVGQDPPRFL